jgi:uncharacterized membrane protein
MKLTYEQEDKIAAAIMSVVIFIVGLGVLTLIYIIAATIWIAGPTFWFWMAVTGTISLFFIRKIYLFIKDKDW